jgi:hypothetical protein
VAGGSADVSLLRRKPWNRPRPAEQAKQLAPSSHSSPQASKFLELSSSEPTSVIEVRERQALAEAARETKLPRQLDRARLKTITFVSLADKLNRRNLRMPCGKCGQPQARLLPLLPAASRCQPVLCPFRKVAALRLDQHRQQGLKE